MHYANNTGFTTSGYGKRKNGTYKSSAVKVINADWKTVPWEDCFKIYTEAANLAEATATEMRKQGYANYVEKCALDGTDPKPLTAIPDKRGLRRRAGQKAIIDDFIPKYKIVDFGIHYMPQIVQFLANLDVVNMAGEHMSAHEYVKERLEDSPVSIGTEEWNESTEALSGYGFLERHFTTDRMKGLYYFLMLDSRSSFIKQQYKGEARAYCALVPTIMFAFKLRYGIPYEAWNIEQARLVMPHELYEAATIDVPDFTTEELLEARTKGLVWKTGEKAGQPRSPLYTHKLYGMQDTLIGKLPELTQAMLTQIWCAHPDNRTKYMILEPCRWDYIPISLIEPTPTFTHTEPAESTESNDLPWL